MNFPLRPILASVRAVCCLVALASSGVCGAAMAQASPLTSAPATLAAHGAAEFECGGEVEMAVWGLWDGFVHEFVKTRLLQDALKSKGDTYSLYDLQSYAQNMVAMAVRCGRVDRLESMAELINDAYDQLTEVKSAQGLGWVCRGGKVCNDGNRLAGTEVRLTSVQFLVMSMRVANALATPRSTGQVSDDGAFVRRSVEVALAHLVRWNAGPDPMKVADRLPVTPATVKGGSSRYLFTDQDLWTIALYAEVAGVLHTQPDLLSLLSQADRAGTVRSGIVGLLKLYKARTWQHTLASSRLGRVTVADVDRGYWRLYGDSRSAGYGDAAPPVTCDLNGTRKRVVVLPDSVPVVDSIGWDFSHARRLVHAMDAIDRNRAALQSAFGVAAADLPSIDLAGQYASQLVVAVWNGDEDRPLFANYWDGTRGWYRVAYDRGEHRCFEGYPPDGLSDAFATGGYAVWRVHHPVIGKLAERLYRLSRQTDADSRQFIETHYQGLADKTSSGSRSLTQLMFWPTLVYGRK